MAKRRTKTKRSRPKYKGAFKIFPAMFAYANLHILSTNILGTTPMHALTAGTKFGTTQGSGWRQSGDPHTSIVTLHEIFRGAQVGSGGAAIPPFQAMTDNFKANWVNMLFAMAGLKFAKVVIGKSAARRDINKLVDAVGVGSIVRA